MKIFITTQYKENYGAHDWNGEGECPQYWKFKGGENYVAFIGDENAEDVMEVLKCLIEYSNDGSMEYVLNYTVLEDNEKLPFEIAPFEPTVCIVRNANDEWCVTKSYLGEAWYGSNDYLGKTESWVMKPKGERADYTCHYVRNLFK